MGGETNSKEEKDEYCQKTEQTIQRMITSCKYSLNVFVEKSKHIRKNQIDFYMQIFELHRRSESNANNKIG